MKVLHVTPSISKSYGGPTQSLRGYVAASRHRGADVTVATPRGTPEEHDAFESVTGIDRVKTFRTFGSSAFMLSPDLVRWVASNSASYDVVHVHGLFNPVSTLAARAAIASGASTVIRPFGTLSRYTFEHRRSWLKKAYFALLERSNLERASGIHFTTDTERDAAAWHGLDLSDRAYVVPPPWIASEEIPGQTETQSVALFIGRLNRVKNLEALIAAWPIVLRQRPQAKLVIAGSGDAQYLAALKSRVTSRGLETSVSFPGFLSDEQKARAFASSTVLVLPSHHENFGVVVLEAIGAGLPVVISPEVQLAKFVTTNGLGIVAESSPESLGQAILSAFGDRQLHEWVRDKGRGMLSRNYSAAVVGEMLEQMYLACVRRERSTSAH